MRAIAAVLARVVGLSLAVLTTAAAASASPLSDFQARFAQTLWCIQQTEAVLRTLPQSSTLAVSLPDGLASFSGLVSENVASLAGATTGRELSDADRKAMADGLNAIAVLLRDQQALAGNRGLAPALSFASAEQSCRAAVAQLAAARPRTASAAPK